jgi:two-component system, OmpR family, response regulator
MNTQTMTEHILVVDDDSRIRQMLSRYFEGEGYRVSLAGDGQEMRECLEKQPIDIILLDLVLPGEDGLALARDIRARSDVPIIMLTGRNDVVDRVVGLEVGADEATGQSLKEGQKERANRLLVRRDGHDLAWQIRRIL